LRNNPGRSDKNREYSIFGAEYLTDMDAVITYVNSTDPLWQREYAKATGRPLEEKRFRDWGTLKYLLRGIGKFMPFVENVFLVVSSESQMPSWASEKLHMVCHKDIIPQELLPVFNSCAIEMFLHRIPGLDEEFIYFNDDMFPVAPCNAEDFFMGGRSAIGFSRHLFAGGMYKKQCRNSDHLARKALGMGKRCFFVRPQHTCSPMLKSECDAVYKAVEADILGSITPLRTSGNVNQYLFLDYLYYSGKTTGSAISNKHLSQAVYSGEQIAQYIRHSETKLVCINDVHMSEEKYASMREKMLAGFEYLLPDKSRFEIQAPARK